MQRSNTRYAGFFYETALIFSRSFCMTGCRERTFSGDMLLTCSERLEIYTQGVFLTVVLSLSQVALVAGTHSRMLRNW